MVLSIEMDPVENGRVPDPGVCILPGSDHDPLSFFFNNWKKIIFCVAIVTEILMLVNIVNNKSVSLN